MIDIDKTGFHYCRNLRQMETHAETGALDPDIFTLGPIDATFSGDNSYLYVSDPKLGIRAMINCPVGEIPTEFGCRAKPVSDINVLPHSWLNEEHFTFNYIPCGPYATRNAEGEVFGNPVVENDYR